MAVGRASTAFWRRRLLGPLAGSSGWTSPQQCWSRPAETRPKLGINNVSFRQGDIEALPLEGESVDVVISNCVINLAPDKDAVFREAFRVLRRGGRLMVSDILLERSATAEEMEDLALYAGCISGSLPVEEYLGKIRAAGFEEVGYDVEAPVKDGEFWFSAAVSARKGQSKSFNR